MDNAEARAVLISELTRYRDRSYEQLCGIVDAPKRTFEIAGPSGTRYQIDVYACWDSKPHGDVRVMGCIDDGGWRVFLPLSEDFIKTPDGPES